MHRLFPVFQVLLIGLLALGSAYVAGASPQSNPDDPISQIVSPAAEPDFATRHSSLHAMPESALRAGTSRLIEFLDRDTPPPGMEPDDLLSLKNDVADRFIVHDIAPAEHFHLALRTIGDRSRDFVWRDYCLQKLPELIAADALADSERQAAAKQLQSLIAGSDPGLTGTALIAAWRLGKGAMAEWAPPVNQLGAAALTCAQATGAPLIDRVTALQVAAELKHFGTAAYAASLLHDDPKQGETVPAMLRTSAIAALGALGESQYLSLVEQHRRSPDIRLRAAARTALDRIAALN